MRVSVLEDDIGYKKDFYNYKPFLDGVALDNCLTADEEKGECLIHPRPFRLDGYGELVREILTGRVRIEKVG